MDSAFDTRKFVRIQSYGCELYSKTIEDEAIACGLTKPEADVLLFFSNNPALLLSGAARKWCVPVRQKCR